MTIQTKFYENQLGFVGDVIKTFWCFFRFTFPTAIHLALKMRPISFTRQCRDIIQVRGKSLHYCMANLLRTICTKVYQNRPGFVEGVTKTFWCVFFGSKCSHCTTHAYSWTCSWRRRSQRLMTLPVGRCLHLTLSHCLSRHLVSSALPLSTNSHINDKDVMSYKLWASAYFSHRIR